MYDFILLGHVPLWANFHLYFMGVETGQTPIK